MMNALWWLQQLSIGVTFSIRCYINGVFWGQGCIERQYTGGGTLSSFSPRWGSLKTFSRCKKNFPAVSSGQAIRSRRGGEVGTGYTGWLGSIAQDTARRARVGTRFGCCSFVMRARVCVHVVCERESMYVFYLCVRVRECVCVRACVRVCVCMYVRAFGPAFVRSWVRACVRVCGRAAVCTLSPHTRS